MIYKSDFQNLSKQAWTSGSNFPAFIPIAIKMKLNWAKVKSVVQIRRYHTVVFRFGVLECLQLSSEIFTPRHAELLENMIMEAYDYEIEHNFVRPPLKVITMEL